MLTGITLTNFRRFERHEVPLRPRTVIVGPNNAGKSTIVEAIRLVSLVANRYRGLQYGPVPDWLNDPVGPRGVSPSLRDLNTNLKRPFHAYGDPPAVIEAQFDSGSGIAVYIGPDENVFAVVRDSSGRVVMSKAQANHLQLSRVAIQPQVAPVNPSERVLDETTVRRGMDSPLAPSHFRNQLRLLGEPAFGRLVTLAEATWPTLQVRDLVGGTETEEFILSLLIRDGAYVGELASMGHGLQMWLQVLWFLARNEGSPTIVLDEPDVYLHADLQRKLMRLVAGAHQQVIVATHSVEIMAEVDPASILTVNSDVRRSRWANGLKGVQRVVDTIGGVHNLQLARLSNAKRCLFLEGEDDLDLLRRSCDVLMPLAAALDTLPHLQVGGWEGWQRVIGTAQFLRNSAGDVVMPYAIFDSDYHEPSVVVGRYEEAARSGIRLHIWQRKEIENYLLQSACLQRVITSKVRRARDPRPTLAAVEEKLAEVATALLDKAMDRAATLYLQRHRDRTVGTANAWVRSYMRRRLQEPEGLLSVAPGKLVLEQLDAWADETYGVTFGPSTVAQGLEKDEVLPELREVLDAIQARREIDASYGNAWTDRC